MGKSVVATEAQKNLRFIPVRLDLAYWADPDTFGPTYTCFIAGRHVVEVCAPESMSGMKIKNKIVPAPARKRFPIDTEPTVEGKTQDALVCPSCAVNVLVPHERK